MLVVGGTEFIGLHVVRALVRPRPADPFVDCHAVYTTTKIRAELDIRPRYTLPSGLAQTFQCYLGEGPDRHPVDILRRQGAPCR